MAGFEYVVAVYVAVDVHAAEVRVEGGGRGVVESSTYRQA